MYSCAGFLIRKVLLLVYVQQNLIYLFLLDEEENNIDKVFLLRWWCTTMGLEISIGGKVKLGITTYCMQVHVNGDPLRENESDVGNFKNWVIMHGWKEHISSSNLVLCLSFGLYRVAELLPFEISHYTIFGEKQITSKMIF